MLTQCIYNVYKMFKQYSFHCILPPKTELTPQGLDNVYTSLYKLANGNI